MTKELSPTSNAHGYGSGLCYSLALFLTHEANFKYSIAEVEMMAAEGALSFDERERVDVEHVRNVTQRLAAIRWFTHAVHPIRNLVIPDSLPASIRHRLTALQQKCVACTLPEHDGQPTPKDVAWALDETRELLRQIDEFHDVATVKENPSVSRRREPALVFNDRH